MSKSKVNLSKGQISFCNWMEAIAKDFFDNGSSLTANSYWSCLSSVMRYTGGVDFGLPELTREWLSGYICYMHNKGLSQNTQAFYLCKIRAAYNRAVDKGFIGNRNSPFSRFPIRRLPTEKRAVPNKIVKKLEEFTFSTSQKHLEESRDMFLFSFYTRGMPPVDMAGLRYCDIRDGAIYYARSKTGSLIRIRIEEPIRKLIEKYRNDGPYVLPILQKGVTNKVRVYRSAFARFNRNLHTLQEMLHLTRPLTMYVARHTWATNAKKCHISLSVISEAMGHSSEEVTRIYLASFDMNEIDEANKKVLGLM